MNKWINLKHKFNSHSDELLRQKNLKIATNSNSWKIKI